MRTFRTHGDATRCALRVHAETGRKARVSKVSCIGTRKPWTVSEAHA